MAKNSQFDVIITGKDALSGVLGRAQKNVKSFFKDLFSVSSLLKGLGAVGIGVGFGAIFRSAIAEAKKAEEEITRLRTAVRNAGGDFDTLRPSIESAVNATARLSGQAKGDLREALQQLITQTNDAQWSIENMGLVADVAAGRNISLVEAATLVGKVGNGNTKIMKELGIATKDPAQAIAELSKRYAGFAANEGKGITGTLNRMRDGWKANLEALGGAITKSDAWAKTTNAVTDTLAKMARWVERNEGAIGQMGDAIVFVAAIGKNLLMPFLKIAGAAIYGIVEIVDRAISGLRMLWGVLKRDWEEVRRLDEDLKRRAQQRFNAVMPSSSGRAGHLGMADVPGLGRPGGAPRGGGTSEADEFAKSLAKTAEALREEILELTKGKEALERYRLEKSLANKAPSPATKEEIRALFDQVVALRALKEARGEATEKEKAAFEALLKLIDAQYDHEASVQELIHGIDIETDAIRRRREAMGKGLEVQREVEAQLAVEAALRQANVRAGTAEARAIEDAVRARQKETSITEDLNNAARRAQETAQVMQNAFLEAFGNISARGKAAIGDVLQVMSRLKSEIKAANAEGGGGAAAASAAQTGAQLSIAAVVAQVIVGGINEQIARMKESKKKFQAAVQDWNDELDSFVESLLPDRSQLAALTQDSDKLFADLEKQVYEIIRIAAEAGRGLSDAEKRQLAEMEKKLAEAREAVAAATERLIEQERVRIENAQRDLNTEMHDRAVAAQVRELYARGLTEEAEALERQHAERVRARNNLAEVAAALKDGLNPALVLLAQAAEAAAEAAERAAEAEAHQADLRRAQEDLDVELLRAQGLQREADLLQLRLTRERAIAEAIASGQTEEYIAKLEELFDLQLADIHAREKTDAAGHAAQLLREQQDLEIELLRAKGLNYEADLLELELLHERAVAEAIAAGQTEEYIAKLAELFDLRREAIETRNRPSEPEVFTGGGRESGAGDRAHASAANITVQQANLLVDIARSSYVALQNIELNTKTLRALGTGFVSIPSSHSTFTGPVQVTINGVNAGFGATPEQVVRALKRAIDKELGAERDQRRRDRGNAFTS